MSLNYQQGYIPLDYKSARSAPMLLLALHTRIASWRRIAIEVRIKRTDWGGGGGGVGVVFPEYNGVN